MDFAVGVYLSQAQNPLAPLLHIIYMYTVYLFTQGRVEELNQREGERGKRVKSSQRWFKIQT